MNTERLTELKERIAELSKWIIKLRKDLGDLNAFWDEIDEGVSTDLLAILSSYEAALPLLEAVRKKPGGDLIEEIRLMDNQPVYNDSSLLCAALAYKEWMGKFNETAKDMTAQRDAAHSGERLSAQAYANLCAERDELKKRVIAAQKMTHIAEQQTARVVDERDALKAELEKVKDNLDMMTKNRDHWLEKTQGAEAELARRQPLIEAVEKARKSTLTDDRIFWGVDEDAILRAALAYKERSQPNE